MLRSIVRSDSFHVCNSDKFGCGVLWVWFGPIWQLFSNKQKCNQIMFFLMCEALSYWYKSKMHIRASPCAVLWLWHGLIWHYVFHKTKCKQIVRSMFIPCLPMCTIVHIHVVSCGCGLVTFNLMFYTWTKCNQITFLRVLYYVLCKFNVCSSFSIVSKHNSKVAHLGNRLQCCWTWDSRIGPRIPMMYCWLLWSMFFSCSIQCCKSFK